MAEAPKDREIRRLRGKTKQLEDELRSTHSKLKKVRKYLENEHSERVELATGAVQMFSEFNDKRHEHSQLHDERTRAELDRLRSEIRELYADRCSLEEKLKIQETGQKDTRLDLLNAEERIKQLSDTHNDKVHSLKSQIQHLRNESESNSIRCFELGDKNETLYRENIELKREVSHSKCKLESIDSLQKRIKDSDNKRRNLEAEVRRLSAEVASGKALAKTLAGKDELITSLSDTVLKLEGNAGSLERERERLLRRVEQEKENQEGERVGLIAKVEGNAVLVDNLQRKINDFEKKSDNNRRKFNDEVCDFRERLSQKDVDIATLEERLATAKTDHHRVKVDLERLQKGTKEVESQCKRGKEEVARLRTVEAQMVEAVEKERREASVVLEESKEERSRLAARARELQTLVSGKDAEMERLSARLTERTRELEEANRELIGRRKDLQDMKAACDVLEQENMEYEAVVGKLEEQKRRAAERLGDMEGKVRGLEVEKGELLGEVARVSEGREREERRHREAIGELGRELEAARAETRRVGEELQENRGRVGTLVQRASELEYRERELGERNGELQLALTEVQGEREKLRKELEKTRVRAEKLGGKCAEMEQQVESGRKCVELRELEAARLEQQVAALQHNHYEEKIRWHGTVSQQGKLIDFLQGKSELVTPGKKRKGGIFKRSNPGAAGGDPIISEAQNQLEREKTKSRDLESRLNRAVDAGNAAKIEASLLKQRQSEMTSVGQSGFLSGTAVGQSGFLSGTAVGLSSSSFLPLSPTSIVDSTHTSRYLEVSSLKEEESVESVAPVARHDIPHRLVAFTNMRPTECAVCVGSVHFGRKAARCSECGLVCHQRCRPSLSNTCGIPQQLLPVLQGCRAAAQWGEPSTEGWLKVPTAASKSGWVKKWANLSENKLILYDSDLSDAPVYLSVDFHCCSHLSVQPTIPSSQLPVSTTSAQLIEAFALLRDPEEPVVLLANGYEDKKLWLRRLGLAARAVNERIAAQREAKIVHSRVLQLPQRMAVNCCLIVRADGPLLLLGTDYGLIVGSPPNNLGHLDGITGAVAQLELLASPHLLLLISGDRLRLQSVDAADLLAKCVNVSNNPKSRHTVYPHNLRQDLIDCHLFAASSGVCNDGNVYVAAALPDSLLLLRYYSNEFLLVRNFEYMEPCSCLMFLSDRLIVGGNSFYSVDLSAPSLALLLDEEESSLSRLDPVPSGASLPVSIIDVTPPDRANPPATTELLLCFHEVGVFVSPQGIRTRGHDLRWSGMPLGFRYRDPYLYVIHFHSVEVRELSSVDLPDSRLVRCHFHCDEPHYVGNALNPSAIYVHTTTKDGSLLLCLQGNMKTVVTSTADESVLPYLTPLQTPLAASTASKKSVKYSEFLEQRRDDLSESYQGLRIPNNRDDSLASEISPPRQTNGSSLIRDEVSSSPESSLEDGAGVERMDGGDS